MPPKVQWGSKIWTSSVFQWLISAVMGVFDAQTNQKPYKDHPDFTNKINFKSFLHKML
jgi:hypothetical protein